MAPWSPPFFRIYSPTPNPKSSSLNVLDAEGAYIKHFVPELKDMPAKFIYAPWTAPGPVQQKAKCIIGTDYPQPIVDHKTTSKANLDNFKKALDANRSAAKGAGKDERAVGQWTSAGRATARDWSDSRMSTSGFLCAIAWRISNWPVAHSITA